MRVPILRSAGPRSSGCWQVIAFDDLDPFKIIGQGAGGRKPTNSRPNNERPPTELMRTAAIPQSRRSAEFLLIEPKSFFDQVYHSPVLSKHCASSFFRTPCTANFGAADYAMISGLRNSATLET
jgi:hypothetical protein